MISNHHIPSLWPLKLPKLFSSLYRMYSPSSIQFLSPAQSPLSPQNLQSSLSGLAASSHALEFCKLPHTPYWHIWHTEKTPIWKRKEWGTPGVAMQTRYQILLERNDKSSLTCLCGKFTTFPCFALWVFLYPLSSMGHLWCGHWGLCPPWGLLTFHNLLYFAKVRSLRVTLGVIYCTFFF